MSEDKRLQNYLVQEYLEDYVQRRISRREALAHLVALTGSIAAASTLLLSCTPAATSPTKPTDSTLPSPRVSEDDPSIRAQAVSFAGGDATISGYLARPAAEGNHPAILVCHENRGLTEHIKDVTRRVAKAGYVGLSVDLLSREGGSEKIPEAEISGILGGAEDTRFVGDFQAGIKYLKTQAFVQSDRFGMTGFCFGGGVTWLMAARTPELRAAVPFYGPNPPLSEVPNIQAPVLAIYGELDQRINEGIPAIKDAMDTNQKTLTTIVYPSANHAFHNDTNSERYHSTSARDAWAETIKWFDLYVKG